MSAPPIAASKKAKSKLKAFQFIEGAPEQRDDEAIPAPAHEDRNQAEASRQTIVAPLKPPASMSASKRPPGLPTAKTFPSTPVTRLPLADLIGGTDHALNRLNILQLSPEERIGWGHSQSPDSKLSRQGPRKRARSSSPASSSQHEVSARFSQQKDAFSIHKLQQTLKTPQADPAADLWSRYAINTNIKDNQSLAPPIFSHLINESSPRVGENRASSGGVGGLRRWASCGTEWPTSASKRRRTNDRPRRDNPDHVLANISGNRGSQDNSPGKSRVGRLVEMIHESLTRQPRAVSPQPPSSSSPLPEKNDMHVEPYGSPSQKLESIQEQPNDENQFDEAHAQPEGPVEMAEIRRMNASQARSSDFGSEDFDETLLEAIKDESSRYTVAKVESQPVDGLTVPSVPAPEFTTARNSPTGSARANQRDEEEFDCEDEDGFAGVASMYDACDDLLDEQDLSQLRSSAETVVAPQAQEVFATADYANQGRIENTISDDEFGDDELDEDQLAAVEAACTQFIASGNVVCGLPHRKLSTKLTCWRVTSRDKAYRDTS